MAIQTKHERRAKWLAMRGLPPDTVIRDGTPPRPDAAAPTLPPPPTAGKVLRRRLQDEFGVGCTTCFNAVLNLMDELPVETVLEQAEDFAKALRENAAEAEAKGKVGSKRLREWAGKGLEKYQQLIVEACEAVQSSEKPADSDILQDAQPTGASDGEHTIETEQHVPLRQDT